ncbi:uncharacterized protein NDAI_0D03670 [Naumovozyma dairenensis CBS 421]|uniref:Uncharacterized protein n=1 Tax=Naumovozyma dairenensis (strain ATCC 10597 / BCRC 20456 / CBS 421 / NBRC 0211 / NRRL Y-12639) TaxID=1071378 RepID=G0WA70_NAUDC|nr:hypothetical protein NDAI_0D03670 [Naumovozyma dairenensis CBS 421]CCD24681.1 hypothetical protein NDAI_0D03670 [Naumovozyma dairenensis CBS 421]
MTRDQEDVGGKEVGTPFFSLQKSTTQQGIPLRRPFGKRNICQRWEVLKGLVSGSTNITQEANMLTDNDWIMDEPFTFGISNDYSLAVIYRDYIMKHYLVSPEYFVNHMGSDFPIDDIIREGNQHTLVVVGNRLEIQTAYLSCDIDEKGKHGLNDCPFFVPNVKDLLVSMERVQAIIYKSDNYKKLQEMPFSPFQKSHSFDFLPPSPYSGLPIQAIFFHCTELEAETYRELLVVYRNRVIRQHDPPTVERVMRLFLNPPYEIYVRPSFITGKDQESADEFSHQEHSSDVTCEERKTYQYYTALKGKNWLDMIKREKELEETFLDACGLRL